MSGTPDERSTAHPDADPPPSRDASGTGRASTARTDPAAAPPGRPVIGGAWADAEFPPDTAYPSDAAFPADAPFLADAPFPVDAEFPVESEFRADAEFPVESEFRVESGFPADAEFPAVDAAVGTDPEGRLDEGFPDADPPTGDDLWYQPVDEGADEAGDEPMGVPARADPVRDRASRSPRGDGRVPRGERPTGRPPRQRPPVGTRTRRGRRAPVLVAATVTTALGALLVWVPVAVLVLLATRLGGGGGLGVPEELRASCAVWLLAHGVPMYLGTVKVSLAPLALTVLAGWRVARAGVHTTRAIGAGRRGGARPAFVAALCVAAVYALLGALAAALAQHGALTTSPLGAGLRMGAFALVLAGIGAAVESGVAKRQLDRISTDLRDALRAGVVAALLVLAAGAAGAGVAVAVHAGDASDVLRSYHAGVAGQAGLTLICLVYGPNLAVWGSAYLVGPGFAVGVGTSVSPANVILDPLPAVPVLVGLPTSAVSGLGVLLLGVPVAGGMVAGWLLLRRRLRRPDATPMRWTALLGTALVAGPVAGVLLGLAAVASGGSFGADRLAEIGPVGWQVAVVGSGVVALGVLLGGAASAIVLAPAPARSRRR